MCTCKYELWEHRYGKLTMRFTMMFIGNQIINKLVIFWLGSLINEVHVFAILTLIDFIKSSSLCVGLAIAIFCTIKTKQNKTKTKQKNKNKTKQNKKQKQNKTKQKNKNKTKTKTKTKQTKKTTLFIVTHIALLMHMGSKWKCTEVS